MSVPKRISNRRKEMGEVAWAEYQEERILRKVKRRSLKERMSAGNWRETRKKELVNYKGGKCEICGYNKPIWSVYAFHHLNPEEKEFGISGKRYSMKKMKKEVDKCQLLCQNCHTEIHDKEYKANTKQNNKKLKKQWIKLAKEIYQLKKITTKELQEAINQKKTMKEIAEQFGRSRSTMYNILCFFKKTGSIENYRTLYHPKIYEVEDLILDFQI